MGGGGGVGGGGGGGVRGKEGGRLVYPFSHGFSLLRYFSFCSGPRSFAQKNNSFLLVMHLLLTFCHRGKG